MLNISCSHTKSTCCWMCTHIQDFQATLNAWLGTQINSLIDTSRKIAARNLAIVFPITRCWGVMTNLWPGQENHFPNRKIKILSELLPLFRPGPPGCFIDDFYCKYSNSDQLCISFVSAQWVVDSVVHVWNIVGGRSYYSQDTLVLVEIFCLEKLLLSSPLQGLLPQKSWISWWETQWQFFLTAIFLDVWIRAFTFVIWTSTIHQRLYKKRA